MRQIQIRNYIAVLFIIISMSSFSQTRAFKPYVGLGFHGGMNISDVKFVQGIRDNSISYESLNLVSGGLIINLLAQENAGIQIEANISNRGWKETKDSVYTYRRDMRYLEIPVLTHLTFGKKRLRYVFNLGPYIAFHRKTTESFEIDKKHLVIAEGDSIGSLMQSVNNSIDIGFMIDAGIGVNTTAGIFQVKVRYSQGVLDIFEKYPEGIYRSSQMRNVYFGVSYYYNFYFKGRE